MPKEIMVAVDDSPPSRQAVRYVAGLAESVDGLRCRLVHVQPAISPFLAAEAPKDKQSRQALEHLRAAHAETAALVLNKQHRAMCENGFPEERIETVSLADEEGLAKTLLDYGQANRVDAIITGRRDLSALKKPFMGSVTANLVENSTFLPIWIIDGAVRSSRLMVAVDGSESAMRVIEHLTHVFGGNHKVKFHLLHVIPRLVESCGIDFGDGRNRLEMVGKRGAHHCIDHFYSKSLARFKAAGIGTHQIEIQILEKELNPGKAIIRTAKEGDFGTLVIGRRGINRSFFTGSVSRYVINRAENMALWLVT
ncbi:MAG: universal stress protein [Desulfobacterales bacterium]|nr:universal stress protein [Desulfobacterales bacterium]